MAFMINCFGNFVEMICMHWIAATAFQRTDGKWKAVAGSVLVSIILTFERLVLEIPEAIVPTCILYLIMYFFFFHKFKFYAAVGAALMGFVGFVIFQHGVVVPLLRLFHWDVVQGIELYVYVMPVFVFPFCALISRLWGKDSPNRL